MKLLGNMKVNAHGHLEIAGCDTVELVKQFGTPLYVMDESLIRDNCRIYRQTFQKYYSDAEVIYASKVFSTVSMIKLVAEEGLGLDVVSGGELYTALRAGFPPEHIYFHGNNKGLDEISEALDANIGRFIVDNLWEMELINDMAGARGRSASILLRVSPGIDAHTHHYIKTGMIDSKFGLAVGNGQALEGVRKALLLPNIVLAGLHCHIGSQIFDLASFEETVRTMMSFAAEVRRETGFEARELNVGGGLGIYYSEDDAPQPVENLIRIIVAAVRSCAARYNLALPKIIVEPGRSIVGQAGVTLYTVGSVKNIPGIRKYVAVDGGMTDNPRPALYQAKYEAALANRMHEANAETVSIAGKCCESGDMLIWDIQLPAAKAGDILAVSATGAYNYSMASNYNRNRRPAVVFARDGLVHLVVRRESYEDLIRNDVE